MISAKLDEIKELMEYGVPEELLPDAYDFLQEFENDVIALNLLQSFYSYLPEGMDDSIKELRLITREEGLFLICAIATRGEYIYLVNHERAEFLGVFNDGINDKEVLDFLGYASKEDADTLFKDSTQHPLYTAAYQNEELCPACSTANGEYHTLGCPVEVCPWCGGQLTGCNCRFTILGKKQITSERDLKKFEEKLSEKGRLAYDAISQRPTYPSQE